MSNPPETSAPPVIFLDAVHKIYRSGEVDVQAVRGVSLSIAQGRIRGHHGRERFGKIHVDEHAGLP